MNDHKNLILAIIASVLIIISFQYLWERPRLDQAAQQAAPEETFPDGTRPGQPIPGQPMPPVTADDRRLPSPPVATPGAPALPTPPAAPPGPAALPETRAITGARIPIDTPRILGSIALQGARIDDVTLLDYLEENRPDSQPVRLLTPPGNQGAYYAEHGWIATEAGVRLPDSETVWTADRPRLTPQSPVTLSWDNGEGLRFFKTFAIDADFMLTVSQRVENRGNTALTLTPYGLVNRTDTPPLIGFFILHEGPIGVFDGKLEEFSYSNLRDSRQIVKTSTGGWMGFTDKYWLAALVPDQSMPATTRFLHWMDGPRDKYQVDFVGQPMPLPSGGNVETRSHLFAGAKEVRLLDGYARSLGIEKFDLAIDFGWFYFLTKPFFYLLDILNRMLGNFGLAILAVTVLVKLVFFPLANKSYRSMSQMKKLHPKILELKEKYGDDKARMNKEMMELYKREKINPAASCLPILVQIPVFFALYKVLFVSIEMRHAAFFGWITDLSAPDPTSFINLFGLLPFSVPGFIPSLISIGALPIIMGVTMWLQMRLNPQPPDPIQAKIFMFMPLVFTFIMAPFPAGLVLYWAWNNILSMTQQWYIMKRMGVPIGSK